MQSPATELNHKYIHGIGLIMSDARWKSLNLNNKMVIFPIEGNLVRTLKKLPCSPALLLVCRNRKDVVNVRKAKIVRASHEVRAATLSGDQDWSGEPLSLLRAVYMNTAITDSGAGIYFKPEISRKPFINVRKCCEENKICRSIKVVWRQQTKLRSLSTYWGVRPHTALQAGAAE